MFGIANVHKVTRMSTASTEVVFLGDIAENGVNIVRREVEGGVSPATHEVDAVHEHTLERLRALPRVTTTDNRRERRLASEWWMLSCPCRAIAAEMLDETRLGIAGAPDVLCRERDSARQ